MKQSFLKRVAFHQYLHDRLSRRAPAFADAALPNDWVAWWYRPGPDHPVQPIEDAITEQALRGLLSGEQRPAGQDGITTGFARLRQDIEELERIVRHQRGDAKS
jgi:hypothetical protein